MADKPRFDGVARRVKLSDICSKGRSSLRQKDILNDGPYAVYGASGIVGSMASCQNSSPYIAVIKDGAGVGRVSACDANTSVLGTIQALIPCRDVERDYLFHLVRSLHLGEDFTGSTIPHIYFKDYGQIIVSLPDLAGQKRIVRRLNSIEEAAESARAQIVRLDSLVKSRFVEMLGAEKREKVLLGELVHEMHIGPFGSAMKNEVFVPQEQADCVVYEQKHAIRQSIDLGWRYVDARKRDELKRFEAGPGTILVSCRGTLGKIYQLPDNAPVGIIHPSLMKIAIDEARVNGTFFTYLLEDLFTNAEAQAEGSGVKMAIKAKELAATEVTCPSIAVQERFADFARQVDKSRFVACFGWGVG